MTAAEFAETWGGVIGTLVGVVAGALAAGSGELWRRRAERRRAVAAALADLLEARHHAKAASTVLAALRLRVQIPAEQLQQVRALFAMLEPGSDSLHARYDAAVTQLAGIDPLLAFELRSKDMLPSMIRSMRSRLEELETPAETAEGVEELMLSATLPTIEAALRLLARQHSRTTLREINVYLSESDKRPKAFAQLLDKLFADAAKGHAAATSG